MPQDDAESPGFERLPLLHQRWVSALLPAGIPREQAATCHNCAMCSGEAEVPRWDGDFFHPQAKCCTYFPVLPNFLVGRAVHAGSAGAAVLRAFVEGSIADRAEVSLLGVAPLDQFWRDYTSADFGRYPDRICPYAIEQGSPGGPRCGVWPYRNGVCSTWFCKHERGNTGRAFWQSLNNLFQRLEHSLQWWAIGQLGLPMGDLVVQELGTAAPGELVLRADAWRHWKGTRLAFFDACAEHVEALPWDDTLALAGAEAQAHAKEVRTRFAALLDNVPPARLRFARYQLLEPGPELSRVCAMNSRADFSAPNVLLGVLHHFDGRPTAAVIEQIQLEQGLRLTPGLVRKLYDFGVLSPVEG